MFITVPDQYPGRCLNHRFCQRQGQMVRCLEYETEEHICQFPEPPPQVYTSVVRSGSGKWVPKPWIKPGSIEESGAYEELNFDR